MIIGHLGFIIVLVYSLVNLEVEEISMCYSWVSRSLNGRFPAQESA